MLHAERTEHDDKQLWWLKREVQRWPPPIMSVMCGAAADSASEAPLQEMKERTVTAVMSLSFGIGGRFGGEKYLQWSDAKRITCQAKELESGVGECIAQLVSEYRRFGLLMVKKKKKLQFPFYHLYWSWLTCSRYFCKFVTLIKHFLAIFIVSVSNNLDRDRKYLWLHLWWSASLCICFRT